MHLKKLFIIIMFTIFLVNIAYGAESPVLPMAVYGTADLNGRNVIVDAVITAEIDGNVVGSTKVTTPGIYGSYETSVKMAIGGTSDDIGKEVTFTVYPPGIQGIRGETTVVWQSGGIEEVPLVFNGDEVPLPSGQEYDSEAATTTAVTGYTNQPTLPPGLRIVSDSYVFDTLEGGTQVDIPILNGDVALTELRLILLNTKNNVEFEFKNIPICVCGTL